MKKDYILKLYILGLTRRSEKIIKNLRQILKDELKNNYSLEIINVIDNPELARRDKILATPTLVKVTPPPVRRVIGDFSNKEKLLQGLALGSDFE